MARGVGYRRNWIVAHKNCNKLKIRVWVGLCMTSSGRMADGKETVPPETTASADLAHPSCRTTQEAGGQPILPHEGHLGQKYRGYWPDGLLQFVLPYRQKG